MRIIRRYITASFFVTFAVTLLVFTFVMCIGVIFKITDLLARGVAWRQIALVLLYGVPPALVLAVPVSVLTASLLVFGRLSADGEITALRASGVSLWRIMSGPLLVGVALALFCLNLNSEVAPRARRGRRDAVRQMGIESPLDLLDEGRFLKDFPGMTIYIGRRKGKVLNDVRIYDFREKGVRREVRARSGIVLASTNAADLAIELTDVRVDPLYDGHPGYCRKWQVAIRDVFRTATARIRRKDLTGPELIAALGDASAGGTETLPKDAAAVRMKLAVELNQRIATSLSAFAFVLLGVPLGIKTQRRESTLGVAMSLLLMFVFHLFVILAETLSDRPEFRPDLIMWVPVLLAVLLGVVFAARSE